MFIRKILFYKYIQSLHNNMSLIPASYMNGDTHSEKSPARPMLFYSTDYWQQFRVQFVV